MKGDHMALRDYSDVYVAACYMVLPSYREGIAHEKHCPHCQRIILRESEDVELSDEEYEDDETSI